MNRRPLRALVHAVSTAAVFCLLATAGCASAPEGGTPGAAREAVIYGTDDRYEPYAFPDQAEAARLSSFSVALMPSSHLDSSDPEQIVPLGLALGERHGLCPDERFAAQPTSADCSGTLVAPDTVLTAGHCIDDASCADTRIVFNYAQNSSGELGGLTSADVFRCAEVLGRSFQTALDYAVVRLDRPALAHSPAPLRRAARALPLGAALEVIGHPSGLPQKIADNAQVTAAHESSLDLFAANLDSFPGNSGSGVFLAPGGALAGVLFAGPADSYEFDPAANCSRAIREPNDAPLQINVGYLSRILNDFCASTPHPVLCACGDGTCDADFGEDSTVCPTDCGTSCGDGACNGDESGKSCYVDCGSCGNGSCERHEIARLDCCEDCGCPGGFVCDVSCRAELGNVNGDDRVDLVDADTLTAKINGGWFSSAPPAVADVNCDGRVDAADATALRLAVGAPAAELPCRRIRQLATGAQHTCLLREDGQVRCWGSNQLGQLGTGSTAEPASAAEAKSVALGRPVQQIVAGSFHNCALLVGGAVRCWGSGALGQLGTGLPSNIGDDEAALATDTVLLRAPARQLAAGANHTCALLVDGTVQCWGDNSFGQLGYGNRRAIGDDESLASVPAVALGDVTVELALGAQHSCALLTSGDVRCWGGGAFGQLGLARRDNIGDDELPTAVGPVQLGGSAVRLWAGGRSSCAALLDGSARCWGDNAWGQLGTGKFDRVGDDETPEQAGVVHFGAGFADLAIADAHACARYESGGLRCWGLNSRGQLGQGVISNLPQAVVPENALEIPLGGLASLLTTKSSHTCASLRDGSLRCWGSNQSGQLGYAYRGSATDALTPSQAGPVPLTPQAPTQSPWHFVRAPGLHVLLEPLVSEARRSLLGVRLVHVGPRRLGDLSAFFASSAPVGPSSFDLVDWFTPWSVPAIDASSASSVTVTLTFRNLSSSRRQRFSRFEFIELRQVNDSDWHPDADYFWSEVPSATHVFTPYQTQRVQVVGDDDEVLVGWTRNPSQ